MTEEGPLELADEIGLPGTVKSMAWQGSEFSFDDSSDDLFSKLPKLEKLDIYERLGRLFDANLSILTVVMENNQLVSYLYGVVPLLRYSLDDEILLEAKFSPNFDSLYLVVDRQDNSFGAVKLQTDYSIQENLPRLAKFSHLVTYAEALVTYMKNTVDLQAKKWSNRYDF